MKIEGMIRKLSCCSGAWEFNVDGRRVGVDRCRRARRIAWGIVEVINEENERYVLINVRCFGGCEHSYEDKPQQTD
jgi:hypothetical protein